MITVAITHNPTKPLLTLPSKSITSSTVGLFFEPHLTKGFITDHTHEPILRAFLNKNS